MQWPHHYSSNTDKKKPQNWYYLKQIYRQRITSMLLDQLAVSESIPLGYDLGMSLAIWGFL